MFGIEEEKIEKCMKAGRDCLDSSDANGALKYFCEAMEASSVPRTLYTIGKIYMEYREQEKALKYLLNALRQLEHTDNKRLRPKCLKMLCKAYTDLNNFALVMKYLEEFEQTGEDPGWARNKLENLKLLQKRQKEQSARYYKDGMESEERKHYMEASKFFTKSLKGYSDGHCLFRRAFCYSKEGDYKNAIDDYTRFIEEFEPISDAFINRGVCHFYLENYDEAFADFENAKGCAQEGERTEAELYLAMARHRRNTYNQLKARVNDSSEDLEAEREHVSRLLKSKAKYQVEGEEWHAIALDWFEKWKARSGSDAVPPIYNMDILALIPFSNFNTPENQYRSQQIRTNKSLDKDFIWVQDKLWKYWEEKYGGIDIKRYYKNNGQMESYFIKATVVFKPRRYWIKNSLYGEVVIYLSKYDSYESIKEQCDRINEEFMNNAGVNIDRSLLKTRIWVINDYSILDNLDERIMKVKVASKEMNLEIEGYLLENKAIAQDDVVLLVEVVESNGNFIFTESKQAKLIEVSQENLLSSIIPRGTKGGAIGLVNNWNICYLNSALQCLSHCQELTKYFLTDEYKADLNYDNPLGFNGRLAENYARFLDDMWKSDKNLLCALDLKKVISGKVDQFRGVDQHDSQEFLLHLLDGIHEDLNKILTKPYIENSEANGRPDIVVSREQWEKYLSRNKSVIIDLFAGQFKSRVVCPLCNNISITFDPFTILSIPVPPMVKQNIIFVPWNGKEPCIEFRFTVSETASFESVSKMLKEETKLPSDRTICFGLVEKKKLITILKMETTCNTIAYSTGELYAYECPEGDKDFIEVRVTDERMSICNYPLLIPVNDNLAVIELKKRIFKKLIFILSDNKNIDGLYEEYMEREDPLYHVDICNNRPLVRHSYLKKQYVDCEFCERKQHEDNCPLPDDFTLEELKKKIVHKRNLVLEVHLKKYSREFANSLDSITYAEAFSSSQVALIDCFEYFVREEQLDSENMWYCKQCKKDVRAKKQIELFRLPKILIVHLKRFKSKIFMKSYLTQSKNDEFIEYPINNLDLSRFLKQSNQSAMYNLFGVIMHYGMLHGGHYTATCFNPIKNKWLEFDDSDVSETRRIVDRTGYVLFYKRVTP